jgi:ubiquinol-cytochrome c reductase cytochrome b subunit
MSTVTKAGGAVATWTDERISTNTWLKKNLRKVFPDHWSFMLGEIALWSFIVILLSGVFLTLWFKPSMAPVIYDGAWVPLRGIEMSEAYASTIELSFDVRGGLLMRQIHHWAALLFVAAMTVHMFRIFFTGAFRKPREINWVIGGTLLILGLLAGFTGYSLPDDLLSGTGLRIIEGILLSIPVLGTYLTFWIFGGPYPGDDIISRLFITHVLLVPGLILAAITIHMILIWYQKHTQWAGPGRTNDNVVGYPFFPVYVAKTSGFFFIVFGVITLMAALIQINPVWMWGPYDASQVTSGTQPDWYIGWLDGALRVMPGWETSIFGFTISWNVLIPAVIIPGILTTALIAYPWIEQFVTGDKREHHILDRPRNMPVRTGIGVMAIIFYGLLWLSGGNDFVATIFEIPVNWITRFMQVGLIVLPPLFFWITVRICLGLQRRDREKILHGSESGVVKMLPHGEFIEVHAPVSAETAWSLSAHERATPVELGPDTDENGIPAPHRRKDKVRAKLSKFYFGSIVQKPSPEEYESAHRHAEHEEAEIEAAGAEETRAELPSGQQ